MLWERVFIYTDRGITEDELLHKKLYLRSEIVWTQNLYVTIEKWCA